MDLILDPSVSRLSGELREPSAANWLYFGAVLALISSQTACGGGASDPHTPVAHFPLILVADAYNWLSF